MAVRRRTSTRYRLCASQSGRKPVRVHPDADRVRSRLGKRSIVLVGLMGCGKSSVGRRLAAALRLSFADADEHIETAARKTIEEIFRDHGEAYFREGERRVIARLLTEGPQILATGGGAFIDEATRRAVAENGISVWLRATLPVLMQRVSRRDNRPLLKLPDPEAKMRELMEARYPIYATADITVDSRDVSHDVVVAEIISRLGKHLAEENT